MMRKQKNRFTRLIALVFVLMYLFSASVSANANILSLFKNNPDDNVPFKVANMFPGDYITQNYCVKVSYNGTIKLYFTADIRPGYEKLAEVLKCKVALPGKNKLLYDGPMKDMPDLAYYTTAVNTTENIIYEISVYLDNSVGNEYQDKKLVADFKWWAYTANEGEPGEEGGGGVPIIPPKPGEDTPITPNPGDKPVTPPTPGGDEPTTPPTPGGDSPVTPATPGGDEPVTPPISGGDTPPVPGGEDERPTGELIVPPDTGDFSNPVLWIVLICLSLFIILLIFIIKKKNEKENNPIIKKLIICIAVIIVLAICLSITTFALVYSIVTVDDNTFRTGTVEINLNDGRPVITENEYLFEPGMTVVKDFFIENESSDSVYYKIYFDKISGGLAKVLDVKIVDKETGTELYSGKAKDLSRENSDSGELMINEKRILTAVFHYPEESGNSTKNLSLSFDMCAVATQTRNNPGREF